MTARRILLALALLGTVGWSVWTLTSDDETEVQLAPARSGGAASAARVARTGPARPAPVQPQAAALGSGASGTAASAPAPSAASSEASAKDAVNIFAAYNYKPRVAPAPAAALVDTTPRAPALPFVYTGRLIINGESTYLLLQGDAPLEARLGSNVGDFKLVEAGLDRLVFLHGPSGDHVSLAIAPSQIN